MAIEGNCTNWTKLSEFGLNITVKRPIFHWGWDQNSLTEIPITYIYLDDLDIDRIDAY